MNKASARRAALHGRTLARVATLRATIEQLETVLQGQKGALPGNDAFALQNDLVMANRFFQEWTLVLAETGPARLLQGDLKDAAQAEWRASLDVPAAALAAKYAVPVRTMIKLFGVRKSGGPRRRLPDDLSAAIDEAIDDNATDIEIAQATGANLTAVRQLRFKRRVAAGDPAAIAQALYKKTTAKLLAMPETEAFDDTIVLQSPLRRLELVELAGKGRFRLTELGRAVKRLLPGVKARG